MPQSAVDPFAEADAWLADYDRRQSAAPPTPAPSAGPDPFAEADAWLADYNTRQQAAPAPLTTLTPQPTFAGQPSPRRTTDISLPAEPARPQPSVTVNLTPQKPGIPFSKMPELERAVTPRFEEEITVTGKMPSTLESVARMPQRAAQGFIGGVEGPLGEAVTAASSIAYPNYAQQFQETREAGLGGLEQAGILAPTRETDLTDPQWWAAGLGNALGSATGMALAGQAGGGALGAAAIATTTESLAEAAGVYNRVLRDGATPEEALEKATGAFAGNMAVLGLSNLPIFSVGGNLLKRVLVKSQLEGAQEVIQGRIGNIATGRPAGEGDLESYLIGSMAGGAFAGAEGRGGPRAEAAPGGLAAPARRLTAPELEAIFAEADAELAQAGIGEPTTAPPAPPPAVPPTAPPVPPTPPTAPAVEPPLPPAAGPAAPAAGVPFLITRAMQADLRSRGYDQAAIDAMRPEDAHAILATPAAPPVVEPPVPPAVGPVPQPEPPLAQPAPAVEPPIEPPLAKKGRGRKKAALPVAPLPTGDLRDVNHPDRVQARERIRLLTDDQRIEQIARYGATPAPRDAEWVADLRLVHEERGLPAAVGKAAPPVGPPVERPAPAATYLPQQPEESRINDAAKHIVGKANRGDFDLAGADVPTLKAVLDYVRAMPAGGFPDLEVVVEEQLSKLEPEGEDAGDFSDVHIGQGAPEGAEDYVREFEQQSKGPDILSEIIKFGGMNVTDKDLSGEIRDLREGRQNKFGRFAGRRGVFSKQGLTPEYMAEALRTQHPEYFGDLTTGAQLLERLAYEGRQRSGQFKKVPPPTFAEPIGPMFDEPAPTPPATPTTTAEAPAEPTKVDVNEFGEGQARLPEAGAVRDVNIQTPEFEVPFSLTAPKAKPPVGPRKGQSTLFEPIAKAKPTAETAKGADLAQLPADEFKAAVQGGVTLPMHRGVSAHGESAGQPTWYASDRATAQGYAKEGGRVHSDTVTLKRPYVATGTELLNATSGTIERLRGEGYDGMIAQWRTIDLPGRPAKAEIYAVPFARPSKAAPPVAAKGTTLKDTDAGGSTSREAFYLPPRPGRAPATGKALRPSEIVQKIRELFKVPVRTGRFRERAHGIYKSRRTEPDMPIPQVIRTKVENDLGTLAHELGHHIDQVLLKGVPQDLYRGELERLGAETSGPNADLDTKLAEGVAEYFRRRFADLPDAIARAPNYHAAVEEALEGQPELKAALDEAYTDYTNYLAQDLAARGMGRFDFEGVQDEVDGRTRIARLEANAIDDISDLRRMVQDLANGRAVDAVKSGYALGRLARGYADKATGFLRYGVRDDSGRFTTGASLEKALDLVKGKHKEFAAYLGAKHALERNAAGKRSGISNGEANEIIAEHESETFLEAAKLIYEFKDKLLDYAVAGDVITAASARNFREAYQFHVPLYRVRVGGKGGKAIGLQITPSSYMGAKGGGGDIINPLEGIIRHAHEVVQAVEKKRALYALVTQALETDGGGQYIEEIPPKMQKEVLKGSDIIDMVQRAEGKDTEIKLFNTETQEEADLTTNAKFERWRVAMFQNDANNYVLAIQHEGKLRVFQMDPAIYNALVLAGPSAADQVIRIYAKATNILRQGATLAVGFIVRNPARDSWTAAVQSRYGFKLGYDTMRGLFEYLKAGEVYQLYLQSGAGQSALFAQDRNDLRKQLRRLRGDRLRDFAANPYDVLRGLNPLEGLRRLSEAGEQATRLGEFRLALKAEGVDIAAATEAGAAMDAARARLEEAEAALAQGSHHSGVGRALEDYVAAQATFEGISAKNQRGLAEAGLAARDVTLDFQRAGKVGRPFNQVIAFLNATVQGYDRLARTFYEDPVGAGFRATMTITLPSLALWALNHDDEEYKEIPEWERRAYWHLPLGKLAQFFDRMDYRAGEGGQVRLAGGQGGWLKIPKPFEAGMIFGTAFEHAMDYVYDKDPHAWKRLFTDNPYAAESLPVSVAKNAAMSLLLNTIPTSAIPVMEAWMNYSTHRERYLVSPFEEKHSDPDQHYNRWTTETAKYLGKQLNWAPIKIDHVIGGYLGGLGRESLSTLEAGGKEAKRLVVGGPAAPAKGLRAIPGVAAVYGEPAMASAQSLTDFYKLRDALEQARGSATADVEAKDYASAAARIGRFTHVGKLKLTGGGKDIGQFLQLKKEIDAAAQDISDERNHLDAIFKHPTATPEQKRQAIDRVYTNMLNIARTAMGKAELSRPWIPAQVPVAAAKAQ